jgi:hypothetical protein
MAGGDGFVPVPEREAAVTGRIVSPDFFRRDPEWNFRDNLLEQVNPGAR